WCRAYRAGAHTGSIRADCMGTGPRRGTGILTDPDVGGRRGADDGADERGGHPAARGAAGGRPGADLRPPEPDGREPADRRDVPRPHRGVLGAAARPRPGGRPAAARGGVRGVPRPDLRDARRDPDAADAGRRPDRDVDRPGDDRGPAGRRGGPRDLPGHQHRRRAVRRAARPRGGPGGRAGVRRAHGRPARHRPVQALNPAGRGEDVRRGEDDGMSDLRAQAEDWLAQDPDPDTRAELRAILDAGDERALAARFGSRLEFGTAGLRGELGAGPNRMNRVTVMRAAAGLAARLPRGGRVIIGFDARHGSRRFADDTAAVLGGAGLRPVVSAEPVPPPVLAGFVRAPADVVAGVMVTASHNPPRDNGYKVYWADGSQIVPPLDAEISAAIDAVGRVDELPL